MSLEDYGIDVPTAEEPEPATDHDTTDDYKFSRPLCRALTSDGDRCSNPVRRTDGDPELCAQHHGTDPETIDDTEGESP